MSSVISAPFEEATVAAVLSKSEPEADACEGEADAGAGEEAESGEGGALLLLALVPLERPLWGSMIDEGRTKYILFVFVHEGKHHNSISPCTLRLA